jgi:carbamoyltransferase
MTGRRFHELFGGPPRQPESRIDQRHMDLAASIQAVTDDVVLAIGREAHRATGQRRLVMAGGVALNCVSNGRLLREGPFDTIWIQPAAGDAGGALGAALFVCHQLLGRERHAAPGDSQHGSALGPAYSTDEVCRALNDFGAVYRRLPDEDAVVREAAELLAAGQVVGWFQSRMEFGPRALGARSILGDARAPDMQKRMNLKIKFRESFRPFAPAIRRDDASTWFDMRPGAESPYMLTVASVLPDRRAAIPAVTHVDHSARVQTVDPTRHPRFAKLLDAFNARTGCPLLINTSFNVRGEPIVCTPADAYRCFIHTDIDALVIEDVVLRKSDVPNLEAARAAAGPARVTHGMD